MAVLMLEEGIWLGFPIDSVAMLATLFNGMWSEYFQLVSQIIIVFGARILGEYFSEKSSDES